MPVKPQTIEHGTLHLRAKPSPDVRFIDRLYVPAGSTEFRFAADVYEYQLEMDETSSADDLNKQLAPDLLGQLSSIHFSSGRTPEFGASSEFLEDVLSRLDRHSEHIHSMEFEFSGHGLTSELLASLPTVRALSFTNCDITNQDIHRLTVTQPELEELRIRGCYGITDDGFEHIGEFELLKSLDLFDMSITDRAIGVVGSIESLRTFLVGESFNTSHGLKILEGSNLEALAYYAGRDDSLTDGMLNSIGKMPKLTRLALDAKSLTLLALGIIAGHPEIRYLELGVMSNTSPQELLLFARAMPRLLDIDLYGTSKVWVGHEQISSVNEERCDSAPALSSGRTVIEQINSSFSTRW